MTCFRPAALDFLAELAQNNTREWFHANKARYEALVRDPYLALIQELAEPLLALSPHYRADPRPLGGSLFRIQRDVRFSRNKQPYKTSAGARFFHARGREVEAPVFYLHLQPGASFIAAGLWHPQPSTLRRIRDFLVTSPQAWRSAAQNPAFSRRYALTGESLLRPPRGFDPGHPLIDDIRRKDFVASRPLGDKQMMAATLPATVAAAFADMAPLVDYLCAALDLEF